MAQEERVKFNGLPTLQDSEARVIVYRHRDEHLALLQTQACPANPFLEAGPTEGSVDIVFEITGTMATEKDLETLVKRASQEAARRNLGEITGLNSLRNKRRLQAKSHAQ